VKITCDHCEAPAVAFYPGSRAVIAPGGIVLRRGVPGECRCIQHLLYDFGPLQRDLFPKPQA
jgi:hypothetical protein